MVPNAAGTCCFWMAMVQIRVSALRTEAHAVVKRGGRDQISGDGQCQSKSSLTLELIEGPVMHTNATTHMSGTILGRLCY